VHVQQALDRYALIPDDSDVEVTTAGNIATLSGHVRTWAEHDAVVDAAWRAIGVYDISDNLSVTGLTGGSNGRAGPGARSADTVSFGGQGRPRDHCGPTLDQAASQAARRRLVRRARVSRWTPISAIAINTSVMTTARISLVRGEASLPCRGVPAHAWLPPPTGSW